MGTVTGFTAEHMDELSDANIVDGNVVGDNLILTTRGGSDIDAGSVRGPQGDDGPTGDVEEAPTDDGIYARKNGLWLSITPNKDFETSSGHGAFSTASTSGADWDTTPFDVVFTKNQDAATSKILVHLAWSAYLDIAGYTVSLAGVKVGGVDHWGSIEHNFSIEGRFEFTDMLWLTGLAAGSTTLRARVKVAAASGSNPFTSDAADYFRIEYEEVLI